MEVIEQLKDENSRLKAENERLKLKLAGYELAKFGGRSSSPVNGLHSSVAYQEELAQKILDSTGTRNRNSVYGFGDRRVSTTPFRHCLCIVHDDIYFVNLFFVPVFHVTNKNIFSYFK